MPTQGPYTNQPKTPLVVTGQSLYNNVLTPYDSFLTYDYQPAGVASDFVYQTKNP